MTLGKTHGVFLPCELVTLIFQDLTRQDLINWTNVCWAWNSSGNPLLYHKVSGWSEGMFEKLLGTITEPQTPNRESDSNIISRQQQLAQLINIVEIRTDERFCDTASWYLPMFTKLAALTPNVHAADIYDPSTYGNSYGGLTFDWNEILSSKWPHLQNLKLKAPTRYVFQPGGLLNITSILQRLYHFDIEYTNSFMGFVHLSPPIMTNLMSLKVTIRDGAQYERLKLMLQHCRNTLHTLAISWQSNFEYYPMLNLDDLTLGLPNLKALALRECYSPKFTIINFGSNIEHFELIGHSCSKGNLSQLVKAMIKNPNLKTLRILNCWDIEQIRMALEINQVTLQTLHIASSNWAKLIDYLVANNTQVNNVTTLFFHMYNDFQLDDLANSKAASLANIFPRVERLLLTRGRITFSQGYHQDEMLHHRTQWIDADTLSHFRHLKYIDTTTFDGLVDKSSCKFESYKIPRDYIMLSDCHNMD
ncbi:hypothetical protein BGW37DRAFT_507115, partial [Umbelopsis sp. PMI_123]